MNARSHDEYQENIGAYVLGALPELETEVLERHLATCETCRAEVERLQPVPHALARSVPQVEPPPSLKAGLMKIVREETAQREGAARREPVWRRLLPGRLSELQPRAAMAGALAVLALGVVIGVGADKLARSGAGQHTVAAQVDRRLLPRGQASLRYSNHDRSARVSLTNAPRPPAGRVYQLWIQRGKTIERGPVFTVGANGRGSQSIPGGVGGANAVMVTVEHAGGAPAPTGPPIMRFNI